MVTAFVAPRTVKGYIVLGIVFISFAILCWLGGAVIWMVMPDMTGLYLMMFMIGFGLIWLVAGILFIAFRKPLARRWERKKYGY